MYRIQMVFLCLAGVALGQDFWIRKEYTQWSDEEVRKMITESPWAKDVTVRAPASALGGRGRGSGAPAAADVETNAAGGGRGGRGRGGRGGGAGGRDGGGENGVFFTLKISWRSALPMEETVLKSRRNTRARTHRTH